MHNSLIGDIPSIHPLDCNPVRFVQVYVDGTPYFKADDDNLENILHGLFKSLNIKINNPITVVGKNYEIIGMGEICESYEISDELGSPTHYIILPTENHYALYPNMVHFSKIKEYFKLPLLFSGPMYHTEEEIGFLHMDEDGAVEFDIHDSEDFPF